MLRFFLILCFGLAFNGGAHAQNSSAGMTPCGNGLSLSVTSTSSNVQLSGCGRVAVVWNTGSTEAFFNWGTASTTAAVAATSWSLPPGSSVTLSTGTAPLYIAAITSASTTTLRIVQGTGAPAISGPGFAAGGAAQAVSVADGSDVAEGSTTDAAATQGGTGTISAKLRLLTTQFNTLNTTVALAANQTATQAPVAPATATATKSDLTGCQATSAAINPTTGQQAAVDCDLNNNLLVSPGGAPNFTTSQVVVTTSSTAVCAARALRRSCTITAITGTQQVFCSGTTATTANGQLIPAVIGASFNVSTTAVINCITTVSSQTVSVAETF